MDPTFRPPIASAPAFDAHVERYDRWFDEHPLVYASELRAVGEALAGVTNCLEIGVGTGRFAAPLGVRAGIDPAPGMLRGAVARGVTAVCARGEALPFRDAVFDGVLLVTTLCFVASPRVMLDEARRMLVPGGTLVVGFIDRASALGRQYEARRHESAFYRDAVFYSRDEVGELLAGAGFVSRRWLETLSGPLEAMTEVEPPKPATGTGGFVVVRAERP
ncbi:MAG: methyltransferase domain-containing protein [Vicinamibacteraceae bacterium]|nr:methyltransferase domain-containing protein [Vicinamibacteraceae bacterium]